MVAATSVALNLLSVAAAYGLLVLVFQEGVGVDVFGSSRWTSSKRVPLFSLLRAVRTLDGLPGVPVGRIRERYSATGDTRDAVYWGVSSTARLITGAALIIVAVFLGFAMGDLVMFQRMGFGVAVALLIDATIIRSVLMPAAMTVLGRWNWYLQLAGVVAQPARRRGVVKHGRAADAAQSPPSPGKADAQQTPEKTEGRFPGPNLR